MNEDTKNTKKVDKKIKSTSISKNKKKFKIKNKNGLIIGGVVIFIIVILIIILLLVGDGVKSNESAKKYERGTSITLDGTEFKSLSKNSIESVIREVHIGGSFITGNVPVDDALKIVNGIEIIGETEEKNSDYYVYYIFKMKDGNIYNIYLEGDYLRVGDKSYEVKVNVEDKMAKDLMEKYGKKDAE